MFHPTKPLAYVMSELQTGVTTLRYADGQLEILATHLVPGGGDGSGIKVAPDGTLLLVGDRGNHAIARFAIDPVTGIATYVASTPSGGEIPRDLDFGANGRLLAVANVRANAVQLFSHGSDGTLTPLSTIVTGTPTSVAFLS